MEEIKGEANRDEHEQCRRNMLSLSEEFEACRKAFIALGDETRLQIIVALLNSDSSGIRVGEITDKTNLSRPAVSHHIKILTDAGIIRRRREGTRNYYYLDYSISELNKIETLFQHIRVLVNIAPDRSGVIA